MPLPFPSPASLCGVFPAPTALAAAGAERPVARTKGQARQELYGTWSAVDDVKDKANKLSDAAVKEFEKASGKAQANAGKIELYSPKYYAACTFGGLLACVSVTTLEIEEFSRFGVSVDGIGADELW